MREPDTCFLQLLPDDRGVRYDIGSIDRHFPRRLVTGGSLASWKIYFDSGAKEPRKCNISAWLSWPRAAT